MRIYRREKSEEEAKKVTEAVEEKKDMEGRGDKIKHRG